MWVPALPLPSSMILGKSLHVSELHSREPWSGGEELSLWVMLTLGNNNFDQIFLKNWNQLSSTEGLPSTITWRNEEGIRDIWPGKETPQSHVSSLKGVESTFMWMKKALILTYSVNGSRLGSEGWGEAAQYDVRMAAELNRHGLNPCHHLPDKLHIKNTH